ncbi:MAG: cytochrome-c oxidase, cbb3-type subunit III [Pseudobdellovibrionaceae bacterium]
MSDKDNNTSHDKEIDHITGVETTGHEWDGLKELNNPLPRWWLWVFFVCIAWSLVYFVLYPAWPTLSGATKGTLGYTQEKELAKSQAEIVARQDAYMKDFSKASLDEIMNSPELYAFATAGGKAAFKDNCATCHGTGAEGAKGYPNLNDDDWIWGGTLEDIQYTIIHGIRSGDEEARFSEMPSFGRDGLLKANEIREVAEYVGGISKGESDETMAGYEIFQKNCAICHGADAKGNRELGAPNLSDQIWLYGDTKEDIYSSIYTAHAGVMPAWGPRLDAQTIKQLTIYVHQLGGGENSETQAEGEQPVATPEGE